MDPWAPFAVGLCLAGLGVLILYWDWRDRPPRDLPDMGRRRLRDR